MTRIVFVWGIIAGLIMILSFYLTMGFLETDSSGESSILLGYASMVLAFITSYFGVRKARELSPKWSFWRAWGTGMLIVLVSAVIYVLGWIQYSNNHPGAMDGYFESHIEQLKEQYADQPEMLESKVAEAEDWKEKYDNNAPITWVVSYTEPLLPGILITLIIAILLRKPISAPEPA